MLKKRGALWVDRFSLYTTLSSLTHSLFSFHPKIQRKKTKNGKPFKLDFQLTKNYSHLFWKNQLRSRSLATFRLSVLSFPFHALNFSIYLTSSPKLSIKMASWPHVFTFNIDLSIRYFAANCYLLPCIFLFSSF